MRGKAKQNFFDFILEGSDGLTPEETSRLHDVGIEKLSPEEAWTEMTSEWYFDPEVEAAVALLRKKLETLMDKWERPEYEEEWGQRIEWMWNEADKDEIGTFDYFLLNR